MFLCLNFWESINNDYCILNKLPVEQIFVLVRLAKSCLILCIMGDGLQVPPTPSGSQSQGAGVGCHATPWGSSWPRLEPCNQISSLLKPEILYHQQHTKEALKWNETKYHDCNILPSQENNKEFIVTIAAASWLCYWVYGSGWGYWKF